ncbi:MAG: HlyD family efflux transporter periplasmic adaptor subunit [Deltaproteobacteria bacterium]|nr:HlyD family efflux transporter periplasmic adaptor subunit [Deltaproteobacteria bacterium]
MPAIAAPSAAYVLRIRHRGGRAREVRIDRARVIVGREGADLVLDDDHVCREHAELVCKDGVIGIRDLGSLRGLWVEGKRVPRAILRPGRDVTLGRTRIELLDADAQHDAGVHDDAQTRFVLRPEAGPDPLAVRGGLSGPGRAAANAALPRPAAVRGVLDVRSSERSTPRAPVPSVRINGETPLPSRVERPRGDAPPPVAVPAPAPAMAPAMVLGSPIDTPRPAVPPAARAAVVVIVGADGARGRWLAEALAGLPVVTAHDAGSVIAHVQASPRAVVLYAGPLRDATAPQLLDRLSRIRGGDDLAIVAADTCVPELPSLYYRVPAGLGPVDLRRVVTGALNQRGAIAAATPMTETRAWTHRQVFDICAAVGLHADPQTAAAAIEQGIAQLLPCARASCMYYDADSGELWRGSGEEGGEGVAQVGLVGFVARTGAPLHVPQTGADPRFVARLDDPRGSGRESLLAVPVPGPRREIHAVLVAVREPTQGPFEPRACQTLSQLGIELGGVLHRVAKASEAQVALERVHQGNAAQLFRPEALQAVRERGEHGDVIRVTGTWTKVMYWSLCVMLVVLVAGLCIGEVSQYSTGPAVVRQHGRSDLAALTNGAVHSIEVAPGDPVRKGQILVRLSDTVERATYDATLQDFDTQLRARLRDPSDETAATQLTSLRRALEAARAGLEGRVVRAPHDGIVADVAVTPGQHIDSGDGVLAVIDRNAPGLELVVFLPGGDRPQLQPGMPLRLELGGFDYAYQDLQVGPISEGVIGAEEARRILGPQHADTLPLGGSVVMVRASLPATTFESDGERYPYHDGMGGTAEVRLRDETLIELLIPALKEF